MLIAGRRQSETACKPLKAVDGHVTLKPRNDHPAHIALTHFANLLQELGCPFSKRDRTIYFEAYKAIGGRLKMVCPRCGKDAKFMPINNGGKMKAWFCACSYEDYHTNGLSRND